MTRLRRWRSRRMQHRRSLPQAYDVDVDLGSGRRVTGTVPRVYGDRLVAVTYSKLDGRHLLESWIRLLALIARYPEREWSAVCIGRPQTRRSTRGADARAAGGVEAADVLGDLVAIYDAGRREPIPLPLKTSYAWAEAGHAGGSPNAGGVQMELRQVPRRERRSRPPARVGQIEALTSCCSRLRPGEECDGEATRLGAYAARLWLPMLRAEGDGPADERSALLRPAVRSRPDTTTVLEASAGTGKTFALAGLVTRYLAEGVAKLDEMLLITFSKAASQELRERVRGQILDAVVAFGDPSTVGDNEFVALPARRHRRGIARSRRARLRDALADSTPPPSRPRISSAIWYSNRLVWPVIPMPG